MSERRALKNWFERNPKKTIVCLLLVVICALAFVTEKVLVLRLHGHGYNPGTRRYIRLKEIDPHFCEVLRPTAINLRNLEGVIDKDYLLRSDENGFIMPSKIHSHPDLSVVFLGGSTTECMKVGEDLRFPYLAGRLLENKLHLKVNSYNGGKAGNDSLHSINALLNKVVPLKPDIVVMMHNVNDLTTLLYDKTYWTDNTYRGTLISRPTNFSTAMKDLGESFRILRDITIPNLARALKQLPHLVNVGRQPDEFSYIRGKTIKVDAPFLVREFTMNLQTFIDLCRVRHIEPVLMTMANRLKEHPDQFIIDRLKKVSALGISYAEYKKTFDLFNQTIRDLGAANGVLVIDLARAVPQEKAYIYDVVHLNETGSQLAAALISKGLEPLVLKLKKAGRPNLAKDASSKSMGERAPAPQIQ
jgi:lysophospholipase L1-like esterase